MDRRHRAASEAVQGCRQDKEYFAPLEAAQSASAERSDEVGLVRRRRENGDERMRDDVDEQRETRQHEVESDLAAELRTRRLALLLRVRPLRGVALDADVPWLQEADEA